MTDPKVPMGPQDLLGAGRALERLIESAEKALAAFLGPVSIEIGEWLADPIRRKRNAARISRRS